MNKNIRESGEVMIEATFTMIITILMVVAILAIGFMYYQKYTVTVVTNDCAAKIGATFSFPDTDMVIGFVTEEDISEQNIFIALDSGTNELMNGIRASKYVENRLEQVNFTKSIVSASTKVTLVKDSPVRMHVEVKTDVLFKTPLGFFLKYFGMGSEMRYETVARAEATNLLDYITTVDYTKSAFTPSDPLLKLVNSLLKYFNGHKYAS